MHGEVNELFKEKAKTHLSSEMQSSLTTISGTPKCDPPHVDADLVLTAEAEVKGKAGEMPS